jgi:hypothetical protein
MQHCGYCIPCIIRRAAIHHSFASDPTEYFLENLGGQVLNSKQSEGESIRSFQSAWSRLQQNPTSAKYLIHKPGPLTDVQSDLENLVDMYTRGMEEVATFISGVNVAPF